MHSPKNYCTFAENLYDERKETDNHLHRAGGREPATLGDLGRTRIMTIQVTYRRTSRLSMRIVKNGDVHVSAPVGMPKKEVERFVEEHREWIAEARRKNYDNQQRRAAFYRQLPLQTRAQADDTLYRLKVLIEPMVERHSKEMGVTPSLVYYKAMISRWGVCNVRNRSICFSAYLLLLPEWCVEHVVVHELCHLLEPSHNARFHALMDRYFPRWKEARRETRQLCRMEEDDDE